MKRADVPTRRVVDRHLLGPSLASATEVVAALGAGFLGLPLAVTVA